MERYENMNYEEEYEYEKLKLKKDHKETYEEHIKRLLKQYEE